MSLTLGTMIGAVFPQFAEDQTKLHLAQWNGHEHPLDVYHSGQFQIWQASQTARNFSRPFVAALIATPGNPELWLFAGLWRVAGQPAPGPTPYDALVGRDGTDGFSYQTEPVPEVADLAGRLTIRFNKRFRQSYPYFETVSNELRVSSLVDAPRLVPRFTGYRHVRLAWPVLQRIVEQPPEDWRTALAAVSGVYLITTGDGRHYVGSAYGQEGIWGRWTRYVETGGHGDTQGLAALLNDAPNAVQNFQFAILETLDLSSGTVDVIAREQHWKNLLGSRATGLNLN